MEYLTVTQEKLNDILQEMIADHEEAHLRLVIMKTVYDGKLSPEEDQRLIELESVLGRMHQMIRPPEVPTTENPESSAGEGSHPPDSGHTSPAGSDPDSGMLDADI